MTVAELIALLKTQRQDLPVVYWDAEEDDWVEVVEAVYEDGTTHLALFKTKGIWIESPPEGEELDEEAFDGDEAP